MHAALMENVTCYFVHVQTVSTRPFFGGEGLGTRLNTNYRGTATFGLHNIKTVLKLCLVITKETRGQYILQKSLGYFNHILVTPVAFLSCA